MARLTDAKGQVWEVVLDVATVKRVKELTGCNVGIILNDRMQALADLVGDPVLLIDVVYAICKPQCEQRGISDEEFGQSFSGQTLQDAYDAFMQALIDFFPNRQSRILQNLVKTTNQAAEVLATKAEKQTAELTAETLLDLVSSTPESSESTPAP